MTLYVVLDVQYRIRYVFMVWYNVVCLTYDIVCWHTMLYKHTILYIQYSMSIKAISYIRYSIYFIAYDIQLLTYDIILTYNIIGDIRYRMWQQSRCRSPRARSGRSTAALVHVDSSAAALRSAPGHYFQASAPHGRMLAVGRARWLQVGLAPCSMTADDGYAAILASLTWRSPISSY